MQRLFVAAMSACVLVWALGPAHADEKKTHQYAGATKCRSCHEKDGIGLRRIKFGCGIHDLLAPLAIRTHGHVRDQAAPERAQTDAGHEMIESGGADQRQSDARRARR